MGASSSTACSSTACRSGPREPAQEMGRRLALFHRQGNHPEDGFHAAGDISARPPAIAQCHLDLVHHPAGVGLRVGVAPPVPWPSPPTWPRKIFLVADGAFFSSLAVELALREEGAMRTAMPQRDALIAEALRRASAAFREVLVAPVPPDVASST